MILFEVKLKVGAIRNLQKFQFESFYFPNENKFGMRLLYELKERKIFERDREKEREFKVH